MITFRTFASGSSGNASLLELDRTDGGVDRYLFDAGGKRGWKSKLYEVVRVTVLKNPNLIKS